MKEKNYKIIDKSNNEIPLLVFLITSLIVITYYYCSIDIIYYIKYGDITDFFEILVFTFISLLPGLVLGAITKLIIINKKNKKSKKNNRDSIENTYSSKSFKDSKTVTKNNELDKKSTFENILIIVGIIVFIIASICVHKGFDVKNNYKNDDVFTLGNKNAYVGGDAYNYIINANYFTGYLTFAGCLYIISTLCFTNYFLLKNRCM